MGFSVKKHPLVQEKQEIWKFVFMVFPYKRGFKVLNLKAFKDNKQD